MILCDFIVLGYWVFEKEYLLTTSCECTCSKYLSNSGHFGK